MAAFGSPTNSRSTSFHGRRNFSLPPLNIEAGSPPPTFMACPLDEKDQQLPCIIVTPSSPCRDTEFQIHYFAPEKPSTCVNLLSWFSSSNGEIALPLTSDTTYGAPHSPNSGCSKIRWLRTLLMLAIPLFIVFHLFLLPGAETHLIDVFSSHRHQGSESLDHINWDGTEYLDDELLAGAPIDTILPVPSGKITLADTENNATGTMDIDDFLPTAPASEDGSLSHYQEVDGKIATSEL